MTADMPDKLTRVRAHSFYSAPNWLDGSSTDVLDGLIVDEHVTFTAGPPAQRDARAPSYGGNSRAALPAATAIPPASPTMVPPLGWVPVDDNIGTPVFASVDADCQPGRTPTGRISRKPPRLPYTGGVAYQVFIDGSRDDHSSYFGGGR